MKQAQYINANWLTGEGAEQITVYDPSLGQPIAELMSASADQVDQAVAAARQALPAWLTHHIEAFCSPLYHPMSCGVAVEGVRLIQQHLCNAYHDGQDLVAREGMLVASAMAAVAFQKGLGGVHALAHPLGARYHKHHGLLNAILLPYVLVANRPTISEGIARLARYLELDQPDFDGFLHWVLQLRQRLGIAHSLAEIGLDDEAAVWVGEQALADTSSSDTNACPLSAADYSQIFINAVHGVLPGVNV